MPEDGRLFIDDEPTDDANVAETPEAPDTTHDDVPDVELPNEFELDGETVAYDDLLNIYKNYKNDEKWKANNTQKAQEIAEERRQLEAERQQIEQWRRDYEWQQQQARQQPQENYDDVMPDEIENDPILAAMYRENKELKNKLDGFLSNYERQQWETQTRQVHNELKSRYEDYNPDAIERAIINGRNQFEDAYLADKWKAAQQQPDAIMPLIPESVKQELIKQGRAQLADELRKKQEMKKDAATTRPNRSTVSQIPKGTPKNWLEAREQAERFLTDNKLSLVT